MKKFLKILLIVFAMYATAKWPRQIVFGVEFGYHLVSGIVEIVRNGDTVE